MSRFDAALVNNLPLAAPAGRHSPSDPGIMQRPQSRSDMQSVPHELEQFRNSVDHHESLLPVSEQQSSATFRSPSNSSYPTKQRTRTTWNALPWKIEILSWIGSLCFFIAIIIVLQVLNGRPLPDLRFGITPNAIIGLLATFAQALLIMPVSSAIGQTKWLQALRKRPVDDLRMVDEASRGPWGSFLLIVHRKGGLVACFGASITIMALSISTFFQQVLRYHTVYPYTNDALVPTAQFMNGSDYAQIGNEGSTSGIDSKLLVAPYVALFNPPNTTFSATTSVHCSTSNCTWEPFQTLSICSTCKDLTSTLKTTTIHMDPHDNAATAYNTNYYTLPNGFGLTGIQPGEWINQIDFTTTLGMLNITTDHSGVWDSVAFSKNGSKLLSVFAVGAAPGTIPKQPDTNYSSSAMTKLFAPPIAYECLLQFCIRNIRAEFTNGTLHETETSTTWTKQSQSQLNTSIVLQPPGSATTFVATKDAVEATGYWLSSLLIGNATIDARRGQLSSPGYSTVLTQPLYSTMNSSTTGFPDLMENLAKSLSLSLRQIKYQPSVQGKAFSTTTAAVVTWAWLALPLFELAASLVCLVMVIVGTRNEGLAPWGNSVLAYLFHGLSERPPGRRPDESQGDMENLARGLLVEFQRHEDGGRLVLGKP